MHRTEKKEEEISTDATQDADLDGVGRGKCEMMTEV